MRETIHESQTRYVNQKLELDQPLDLPDGSEVEVEVRGIPEGEDDTWRELGMSRLEVEENPQDAVYDDWRKLYGA